jgi:hypothetical protein
MIIDIYESTTAKNKFVSVPAGTDVNSLDLPMGTMPHLSSLKLHSAKVCIDATQPRAGMNIANILQQISAQGFALHEVSITISTSFKGPGI